MTRADKLALFLALAVIALAYLLTAPAHVIGGDNGEFITLMHEGGVAHPPGYPLYTLYLRALRWLPGTTPAHTAALATALLGIAAAAMLYAAARAWGARPTAALVAMGVYALSPLAWKLAIVAEVFTLNALLAAALLAVCGPQSQLTGTRRMLALSGLMGLGAAHHHSLALLAPVALFGAVLAWRESRHPVQALAGAVAIFGAALAIYLYPYLRSRDPSGWVWANPFTLRTLIAHVLRAEYGTFTLSNAPGETSAAEQLRAFGWELVRDLAGIVAPLAVLGGAWLRDRRAAVLLATFVCVGPLFIAYFNVPLAGAGAQIVERFYLLPELVLCLLFALVIDRTPRPIVAVALAAVIAVRGAHRVREYTRPTIELYARNILGQAPPGAVIVGSGDHCVFGFLYLQSVLGLRPDVTYVHLGMLDRAWYRERVGRQLPGINWSLDARALIDALFAAGHTVYLTEPFSTPIVTWYPSQPEGALVHILTPADPVKDPAQLEQLNDRIFSSYVWEPTVPPDPNTWNGLVQDAYARPWLAIAQMYDRLDYDEQAKVTLVRGSRFVPWLRTNSKP